MQFKQILYIEVSKESPDMLDFVFCSDNFFFEIQRITLPMDDFNGAMLVNDRKPIEERNQHSFTIALVND